jgi:hypothetical protein
LIECIIKMMPQAVKSQIQKVPEAKIGSRFVGGAVLVSIATGYMLNLAFPERVGISHGCR